MVVADIRTMRAGFRHGPPTDSGPIADFCIVVDLLSRRVIGRSAQARMTTDLALQALVMAIWRTKLLRVTLHSDQVSQFTSREWQTFPHQHNLEVSMSRRGNCSLPAACFVCAYGLAENAVAESSCQLFKRERIRRNADPTRDDARRDMV